MKIAKLHRYFDAEGNYHGPQDHKIHVDGEEHDLYEYAKKHGIDLPGKKSSKKIMQIWNRHSQAEVLKSMETEIAKAQNELKCALKDVEKASGRIAFCLSAVHNLKERHDKDIKE